MDAIVLGYTEIVERATYDDLNSAAELGYTDIVRLILKDTRIVYDYYTFLMAIKRCSVDVIKLLVRDPRSDNVLTNPYVQQAAMRSRSMDIINLIVMDPRTPVNGVSL